MTKHSTLQLGIIFGIILTILYYLPVELLLDQYIWRTIRVLLTVPILIVLSVIGIKEIIKRNKAYTFGKGLWKTIKIGLIGNGCYLLLTFICNFLLHAFDGNGLNVSLMQLAPVMADVFYIVMLLLIFSFIPPLYVKGNRREGYEDVIDEDLG